MTGFRGFTLIELLVVLAIISLAIGITAANLSRGNAGAEFKSQNRKLVSMLRHTRNRAISESSILGLSSIEDGHGYQITPTGETVALSENITVDIQPGSVPAGIDHSGIVFFPDGSSNGGLVQLTSAEGKSDIEIIWLTGEVSLVDEK